MRKAPDRILIAPQRQSSRSPVSPSSRPRGHASVAGVRRVPVVILDEVFHHGPVGIQVDIDWPCGGEGELKGTPRPLTHIGNGI
jgi:hypothetical protein